MRGRERIGAGAVEVWCDVKEEAPDLLLDAIEDKLCISKLEFSRRIGYSNATVHKMLKGDMKTCTAALAVAVTVASGVPMKALFRPRLSNAVGQIHVRSVAA